MSFPFFAILTAAMVSASPATSANDGDVFLLVTTGAEAREVRLVEINDRTLVHRDEYGGLARLPLGACIALLDPAALIMMPRTGILQLADGQTLPGQVLSGAEPAENLFVWSHAWLGRMELPLDHISSVVLRPGALPPEAGDADVVQLANGDQVEGFILALVDPLSIEVDHDGDAQVIEIPLDRVEAIGMLTPRRPSKGRRIWLQDGTVVDAASLSLGDDGYLQLIEPDHLPRDQERVIRLSDVNAILFHPGGVIPLAGLDPDRVEGPTSRFQVPAPEVRRRQRPLDLLDIEFRGPLVARYVLPRSDVRLTAEATLPNAATNWGDLLLVIRDDDEIVAEFQMDAANPSALINVPLRGSELTIEIAESGNGPIQDRVVLKRAMLVTDRR